MRALPLLWCMACGSSPVLDTDGMDAGLPDAVDFGQIAPGLDAGAKDEGQVDAGAEDGGRVDAAPDAGVAGFGALSGACGVLDDELTSAEAFFIRNAIDFGTDPYDTSDASRLTEGGREVLADGNAGGNSLLSEVFSFEVLARCEQAGLLKTETEVRYLDPMGKKTDLLVDIGGARIGVSVTRAVGFPREAPYPAARAFALLQDKLQDIVLSTENVAPEDAWRKQILHVLAYAPQHAERLMEAYGQLEAATRADTVVLVTVSEGDDGFLY